MLINYTADWKTDFFSPWIKYLPIKIWKCRKLFWLWLVRTVSFVEGVSGLWWEGLTFTYNSLREKGEIVAQREKLRMLFSL